MYYYSLNEYLKKTFGEKIYKLSLNGGMTCPNRDGTLSTKGCIFCSKGGSGEFATDSRFSVTAQIESAKKKVSAKIKSGRYIAYFQAYTNTYAPVDYLERIFTEAICRPDIVALSVATRPDCLGKDVLDLLYRLSKIKPVWVELGLQTVNCKTAEYIRRGYDLEVYDKAVSELKTLGVQVITHVILGLPGESVADMLKTVAYAGSVSDGIKLQLLHILRGTDLEKDYLDGKFSALTMEEYIDILCKAVEILPKNVVIHRLTGDGDKRILTAPMWSADKKRVLNAINREFCRRGIVQGKHSMKI